VNVFVGGILPYITIVAFVAGMAYRLRAWKKAPQPAKMTLFPAGEPGANVGKVISEALLFPSLFKGDKSLWAMSWVFHATLALVFFGHMRVLTGAIDRLLIGFGMTADGVTWMSSTFGGAAGVILAATAVLLLVRRFTVQRAREITLVGDFVILALLLAIIMTGNLMRFSGSHFDLAQTHVWAWSVLTFSPKVPADGMFLWHALLAQLLIIFIPFSKILHFGGIFFTQALVKRR
jgi:nitrate reductase gamma subunit